MLKEQKSGHAKSDRVPKYWNHHSQPRWQPAETGRSDKHGSGHAAEAKSAERKPKVPQFKENPSKPERRSVDTGRCEKKPGRSRSVGPEAIRKRDKVPELMVHHFDEKWGKAEVTRYRESQSKKPWQPDDTVAELLKLNPGELVVRPRNPSEDRYYEDELAVSDGLRRLALAEHRERTHDDIKKDYSTPVRKQSARETSKAPQIANAKDYEDLEDELEDQVKVHVVTKESSSESSVMINTIRDFITHYLNNQDSDIRFYSYNCGSYYDKSKIDAADEFDTLFYCSPSVSIVSDNPPNIPDYQCRLKLKRRDEEMERLLCADSGFISPKRFKKYFLSLVRDAVDTYEEAKLRKDERDTRLRIGKIKVGHKASSPAITVTFRNDYISFDCVPAIQVDTWPRVCKGWRGKWLSRDDREKCKEKVFVVPKLHFSEYDQPIDACEYWRFGFNHAEKQIILHAAKARVDDENCVRKAVLKLLKVDVTTAAEKKRPKLREVCSYFAKTTMLHVYEKIPHLDAWIISSDDKSALRMRYVDALTFLINAIQQRNLPHYFIQTSNLFDKAIMSDKGRGELDILKAYLMERRARFL